MLTRDFCYWLQGLFELADPKTLDETQTDLIKRHLNLVFVHEIDPSHSDDPVVQGALQAVHDGVDANEVRSELHQIKFPEGAPDEPGPAGNPGDTLTPLSEEKLKELETEIKKAQETADKALKRQIPRGGGRPPRLMC